ASVRLTTPAMSSQPWPPVSAPTAVLNAATAATSQASSAVSSLLAVAPFWTFEADVWGHFGYAPTSLPMFFPTLASYLRMSFVLGTLPVISAAPLSGRAAIGEPAGSQYVRPVFALITGSAMAITPPGVKHGQSAFGLLVVNLVSAAFSQACSSSAGFNLN